ncbi:MAG: hypothetical protein AAF560_25150 [Acidobacteriota bacterium]
MSAKRRNHLIWLGPFLGFAAILSYFMVFARFPGLRDFPWLNLPLALVGLVLSVFGVLRPWRQPEVFRGKALPIIGLVVSTVFASFFVYYIFVLSVLPAASETAVKLTQAPEFTLTASDGTTVSSSDFRGRNVALIFYRGFW